MVHYKYIGSLVLFHDQPDIKLHVKCIFVIIKYVDPAGFESIQERNGSKSWYSYSFSYEASGIIMFAVYHLVAFKFGFCTKYYGYQKIALAWMFQKETSSLHCSGGILADDQVIYN